MSPKGSFPSSLPDPGILSDLSVVKSPKTAVKSIHFTLQECCSLTNKIGPPSQFINFVPNQTLAADTMSVSRLCFRADAAESPEIHKAKWALYMLLSLPGMYAAPCPSCLFFESLLEAHL